MLFLYPLAGIIHYSMHSSIYDLDQFEFDREFHGRAPGPIATTKSPAAGVRGITHHEISKIQRRNKIKFMLVSISCRRQISARRVVSLAAVARPHLGEARCGWAGELAHPRRKVQMIRPSFAHAVQQAHSS